MESEHELTPVQEALKRLKWASPWHSQEWKLVADYLEARVEELKEDLVEDQSQEETVGLRGRIVEIREILCLPME